MKLFLLMLKNLRRNLVRTILTGLGTMVLVLVITSIWSVLIDLDRATSEQSQNLKSIVTDRWRVPSQMPYAYVADLADGAARTPADVHPTDSMSWGFFAGTPTPANPDFRTGVFGFVLEPKKLLTMMDELEDLPPSGAAAKELQAAVKKMESNIQGVIIGQTRLKAIDKRVGDRFMLYGLNYKDINFEVDVVGTFPPGRYDQSAAFNREYLTRALDDYKAKNKKAHPLADGSLNLMWLRHPDRANFERVAEQIMTSASFGSPAVKCETASSGIASFLDSYRDLLFGVRWLLTPAILATLSLIIANAISINVRERRPEMAVMKVLGFRPGQILTLILGESVFLGTIVGLATAGLTYFLVNHYGGIQFRIAFLPSFRIPLDALWWGPAMGGGTAFLGSILPAWSARTVSVSEVFSKIG